MLEQAGVRQGIPGHRHQVGQAARLHRTDAVGRPDQVRRVAGGGHHRAHRRHAIGDQQAELHGVVALADVGAVGDLHAGPHRQRQVLLG